MIEAGVGDDAHVRAEHAPPRHPLILRLQGHALDDQNVRFFFCRFMQICQLLPDIRRGLALDELLAAIGMDGDGERARGLAEDPVSPGSESRRDHAGHRGLAPGAVHVDHVAQ